MDLFRDYGHVFHNKDLPLFLVNSTYLIMIQVPMFTPLPLTHEALNIMQGSNTKPEELHIYPSLFVLIFRCASPNAAETMSCFKCIDSETNGPFHTWSSQDIDGGSNRRAS